MSLTAGNPRLRLARFILLVFSCVSCSTRLHADWEVKPDVPAASVMLTVPAGSAFSINIPQSFGHGKRVWFPSSPSPFVALGSNRGDKDVCEVWDMRTKTRVGQFRGNLAWDEKTIALSPDGQFMAGKPTFRNVVEVRSTKTGRATTTIDLKSPFLDFVDFGPEGSLLIGTLGDKSIRAYSLPAGEATLEIPLPGHLERKSVAFSANRKYLVGVSGWEGTMVIVDLASGDTLAQEVVPKETCIGVAFSADGTELATVFEHFGKMRIMAWSVADGKELCNHELAEKSDKIEAPAWYDAEGIQWLPDKSGFLVLGHAIVDRASGHRVYTLPYNETFNVGPRRWVDNERMLIPFGNNRSLRIAPVPRDKVASAMKIVQSGGNATDAALPPLKPIDWTGVKALSIPATVGPWSVKPDPAPVGRRLTTNPIALKATESEIRALLIPDPQSSIAVLACGVSTFAKQPKDIEGQPGWVERIDLAGGKSLGRFETPGVSEVITANVDGSSVLLVESKTRDRLDLFGGDGKPLASWRPYEHDSGDPRGVTWAEFIDPKRMLTLSGSGKLVLWSIPDLKPLYAIEGAFQSKPVLSPSRKQVVGMSGETLIILDAATGSPLGELAGPLASPGQRIELRAVGFRPDGAELAALYSNAQLFRYDLNTGKSLGEFRSPAIGSTLAYYGPGYVLIEGRTLVDLTVKRALWNYTSGLSSPRSPDGRHWFLASRFPNQPATLASTVLPERGMDKVTAMVANPSTPASLKPGWRVGLDVQMGASPGGGTGEIRQHVIDQLTSKLKANGIVVAPDQKVRYVVRVEEKALNEVLQMRKIGIGAAPGGPLNGANIVKIPVVDLICSLELADGLGAPIACSMPQTLGMRSFFMILHLPPGEDDVALYLKKQQWQGIKTWADGVAPPYFVSRQGSDLIRLPGFTNLHQTYAR